MAVRVQLGSSGEGVRDTKRNRLGQVVAAAVLAYSSVASLYGMLYVCDGLR